MRIGKAYIASLLPQNPTVLEAGARIGKDTRRMSKLWPEGIIHSFEPVPALYSTLLKNTRGLTNVRRYNNALSDVIDSLPLYISSGRSDACSSLLPPKECLQERPDIVFNQTETVPVTTIDAWAQKHKVDHIDFMWLDLQGVELKALQGALSILPTVKVILIEVNLTERYEGIPLYDQIKTWLQGQGFTLDQDAFHHETWGDALFTR